MSDAVRDALADVTALLEAIDRVTVWESGVTQPDRPMQERVEAAIAKARATLASGGWRDISTLPTEYVENGTPVLVWLEEPMFGSRVHTLRPGRAATIGSIFAFDAPKPLYWREQPLPPAPEQSNG